MLEDYIRKFSNYLIIRNKSERTASEYSYDLYMFEKYIQEHYPQIHSLKEITDDIIENYMVFLRNKKKNNVNKPLSPVTINRKYYSLCSFYNFLIKKKYFTGENPTQYIDILNTTVYNTHTYLSIEQSRELLNAINTSHSIRDLLMIEFMLLLGLRVSEVSKIDLADINLHNKTIIVHGKGNKERVLPISSQLEESIIKYLDYRQENLTDDSDEYALFLSRQHKRITVRRIQEIVTDIVNGLGFNDGLENEPSRKKITCHKLRHTFGTLSNQNGVDILVLKEILGHSTINTTTIYTKSSNSQIRDAIINNPIYKTDG